MGAAKCGEHLIDGMWCSLCKGDNRMAQKPAIMKEEGLYIIQSETGIALAV